MLCLAWLKTSRGPTKSRASMPGCSVNNTLMMGTESVAAMVATEWLLRCSGVLPEWFGWRRLMLLILLRSGGESVCVDDAGPHTMTRFPSREFNAGLRMRGTVPVESVS
jgi:hypothetical protein